MQTFAIPRISSSATATAATFNAPLEYILTSLNLLAGIFNDSGSLDNRNCLLQYLAPIGALVSVGDLVYFDTETSLYQKALALLADVRGDNGQSIVTNKGHVLGLVLSIDTTEHSCVLLKQGYCESNVILNTLGVGALAGIYYLSSSNSGKATKTPGWDVRIPCVSYYGKKRFSFMPTQQTLVGLGAPVVRGIKSATLDIDQSDSNIFRILQPARYAEQLSLYPKAIANITPRTLLYVPIVSKLIAGPGMQATNLNDGRWLLSTKAAVNTKLTASDFTLNGTQRVADSLLTYTVFPALANTSMIMALPVNFIDTDNPFEGLIRVWMTVKGPGTTTFSVDIYWLPYSALATAIPSTTNYRGLISANNSDNTKLSLVQTSPIAITLTLTGVLLARVATKYAPGDDCYVHQAGFLLLSEIVQPEQVLSDTVTVPMSRALILLIIRNYLQWSNPGSNN